MREADAPSTEEATLAHRVGARPTGDSHGRTTRGPTQHGSHATRRGLRASGRGRAKGRRLELRPHDRSRCASTGEATLAHRVGARPTGDRYVRTTGAPAQRFKDAK